jgi:hypothetical protein
MALQSPGSSFDLTFRNGDILAIPKTQDVVSIRINNTRATEVLTTRLLNGGRMNVAYIPGKSARWYVNNYAAGLAPKGTWRYLTVEDPNGHIRKTKNYFLYKKSPIVAKGSIVMVGTKPPKDNKNASGKEKKPFDWEKALSQVLSVASVTATIALAISALR